MADDGAVEYQDSDDPFAGERFVEPETDLRHVIRDFTGGNGISGKTDLTPIQGATLTQFRLLQEDYHERFPGLNLDKLPKWFEIYRLSIGRASRKEAVEILRGKLDVAPPLMPEKRGILGRW